MVVQDPRVTSKKERSDIVMRSIFHNKCLRVCFLCLGNEMLLIDWRTYLFCTSGDLLKYFQQKHLSNVREDESIDYKVCKISLVDKMHLQNHAFRIYRIVS
jgi:hypothetical protein